MSKSAINDINISIYGSRGSGKTTLAVGLYASSFRNNKKNEALSVVGKDDETTAYLDSMVAQLKNSIWCKATKDTTKLELAINRKGVNGVKTTNITFEDYKGELISGNGKHVKGLFSEKKNGILFLLNPGMDMFSSEDKTEAEKYFGNFKREFHTVCQKKPNIVVGIVITASDRLDTDLKSQKDFFSRFLKDVETFFDSEKVIFKTFYTTICGKLENQEKPKIAEGEENTTYEPFKWMIKEINKVNLRETQRNKIKNGIKWIVVLGILGLLFKFCPIWYNQYTQKNAFEKYRDLPKGYTTFQKMDEYINKTTFEKEDLKFKFVCLANSNLLTHIESQISNLGEQNLDKTERLFSKYRKIQGDPTALYYEEVEKKFNNKKFEVGKEKERKILDDISEKLNEKETPSRDNLRDYISELEKIQVKDFFEERDDLIYISIGFITNSYSKTDFSIDLRDELGKDIIQFKDNKELQQALVEINKIKENEFLKKIDLFVNGYDYSAGSNISSAEHESYDTAKSHIKALLSLKQNAQAQSCVSNLIDCISLGFDDEIKNIYAEYTDDYNVVFHKNSNTTTNERFNNNFIKLRTILRDIKDFSDELDGEFKSYYQGKKCYKFYSHESQLGKVFEKNLNLYKAYEILPLEIYIKAFKCSIKHKDRDPSNTYVALDISRINVDGSHKLFSTAINQEFDKIIYPVTYNKSKFCFDFTDAGSKSYAFSKPIEYTIGAYMCLEFKLRGIDRWHSLRFISNQTMEEIEKITINDFVNAKINPSNNKERIISINGLIKEKGEETHINLDVIFEIKKDHSFGSMYNGIYGKTIE